MQQAAAETASAPKRSTRAQHARPAQTHAMHRRDPSRALQRRDLRQVKDCSAASHDNQLASRHQLERHYQKVEIALNEATRKRLDDLLKDTTTEKCREEVTSTFIDSIRDRSARTGCRSSALGPSPDCPSQRDNAPKARLRAEDIRLAYLLVVHETPQQITRLIEALEEGTRHNFIIHVDDKPQSESTYNYLRKCALTEIARPRPRDRTAKCRLGRF